MFKLVLEKAREPEIKLPTSTGSSKKQEFQKNIYFCFIGYAKAIDYVDHNKLWKILNEMGIPEHLTYLLRNLYAGQEATELDMEQQAGSKQEKEYVKLVYCHPAYLTYMQSTLWETLGWKKHKLESRFQEERSITPDLQMTPPLWWKRREIKEPWWRWKRRVKKLA